MDYEPIGPMVTPETREYRNQTFSGFEIAQVAPDIYSTLSTSRGVISSMVFSSGFGLLFVLPSLSNRDKL